MSRSFRGKFYHAMRKSNKSVNSYVKGFPVTRKGWGSGSACQGRHRGDSRIEWSQAKYRHQTFSWVLILYQHLLAAGAWETSSSEFSWCCEPRMYAEDGWSGSGELYNILLIFLLRLLLFNPVVTNHEAIEHWQYNKSTLRWVVSIKYSSGFQELKWVFYTDYILK